LYVTRNDSPRIISKGGRENGVKEVFELLHSRIPSQLSPSDRPNNSTPPQLCAPSH
jgi:hypothetical protein